MGYASDVARFDDWDAGKLGLESLDVGQLFRDIAFEESNVRRVGEAVETVGTLGWDWNVAREFLFGGSQVGLMALGFVPSSALKAGRGATAAYGMLSSYDAASRAVRASDVSAIRRALGRRRIAVDDQSLANGANDALMRLGFWREPGTIPGGGAYSDDAWTSAAAAGEVAALDREAGRVRMFHGVSPRTAGDDKANVTDILDSILENGIIPDPKRKVAGPYVWASDNPEIASGFAWGDEPQTGLVVVAEFVTDPAEIALRNGFPSVRNVAKENVAAFHLMDAKTGNILSTKQVNGKLKSILDDVGASRRADGGFTWDPRSNNFDFPDGYIFGVSPLHTKTIPIEEFTAQDVVDYLEYTGFGKKKVSQLLADDPDKMVGGWVEDGLVYLDVSKVFRDRDEAVTIATRLGEKAVWDAAKGESIYTDASKFPSLFARAALAGGAEIDTALLREISDSGLEKFFTGRVGSAELRPELTPIFFGDMTTGQKQWLARELSKETPKRVYTADDFDNPVLAQWVAREREYIKSLGTAATRNLSKRWYTRRFRGQDGDWIKKLNKEGTGLALNKDGEPIDFKPGKYIPDRTSSPLVSFFDEMGLYEVPLSSGQSKGMHRKITNAILRGDTRKVAEILAAETNNLTRFATQDALTPNFYPYMAFMTITGAKNVKAAALAPLLAASSAQVGPGGEAGRLLRAATNLSGKHKNRYRIRNDVAEWTGPTKSGYDINVQKAMVALANNPDFMMIDLPGVSVKTYVYALLKLNPRLSKALVVDTVDMQMRFATRMSPGWDTSKGAEMTEIAMNQMASRAIASMMDIPAFSLQENTWAFFRAIRDRFAGTPKSLTYRRVPLRDIYQQVAMPDDLAALYQKNYAKLLAEVRAGRAPHWQEIEKGVLVPADDLPLELLLPPAIRAKPGYVERFRDMISSAEELGRLLRGSA